MQKTLCGYKDKGVVVTPAQIAAIHRDLPWLHNYVPEYVSVRIQRTDLEVFRSEPASVLYAYYGEWVYERVFVVSQNGVLLYEVGKYQSPPLWRRLFGFLCSELLQREETVEEAIREFLASGGGRFVVDQRPMYIVARHLWADGGCATVYKPKKPATSLIDALEIALEQERQAFEAEVARAQQELHANETSGLDYAI